MHSNTRSIAEIIPASHRSSRRISGRRNNSLNAVLRGSGGRNLPCITDTIPSQGNALLSVKNHSEYLLKPAYIMCFKGIAKHRPTATATALQPDSPTSAGCHICTSQSCGCPQSCRSTPGCRHNPGLAHSRQCHLLTPWPGPALPAGWVQCLLPSSPGFGITAIPLQCMHHPGHCCHACLASPVATGPR